MSHTPGPWYARYRPGMYEDGPAGGNSCDPA